MDLEKLAIIMKNGFDELRTYMNDGFKSVDKRFESVDTRFDSLEKEIRDMRREFSEELRQLREDIENVKGFSKEMDTLISRVAVLESKFEEYIQKQ